MFSYTYETRYGDYKDFDTVKFSSILDIIQDAATKNSAQCGYGMHRLRDMKLAWMLQGMKVQLIENIVTGKPVTAQTAIKSMRGATSERCTLVLQDRKIKARAVANWFLFDFEAGRPIRIPEEITAAYSFEDFNDEFFNFQKIRPCEAERVIKVRISNKEIDTNNHLNNQKSAELLMDALPFDFPLGEMNILYKKPAYLGEELYLCAKKTDDGYYVHLEDEEKEIRVAGMFRQI